MYQPYYTPSYSALPQAPIQQQQAPQTPQSNIQWVQGEEAAKSYLVGAGNSVMLMDSEAQVFYIKSTDPSGMPQPLRVFDYTERTPRRTPDTSDYVTRKELEERLAALTQKEAPDELSV